MKIMKIISLILVMASLSLAVTNPAQKPKPTLRTMSSADIAKRAQRTADALDKKLQDFNRADADLEIARTAAVNNPGLRESLREKRRALRVNFSADKKVCARGESVLKEMGRRKSLKVSSSKKTTQPDPAAERLKMLTERFRAIERNKDLK